MSDPKATGSMDMDVSGEEIESVLEGSPDTEMTGVAQPQGRNQIVSRLMNTNPNPDLDNMDEMEDKAFFSKEISWKFMQRGFYKFTQVGGTALEDMVWAMVNFVGYIYTGGEKAKPKELQDVDTMEEGGTVNMREPAEGDNNE